MKHWQETSRLFEDAARLAATGRRAALATVVRILGSAYRRPGAKLLVAEDGAMTGGVSGGCLEADVREVALGVLRGAAPVLKHYDTGGDEHRVWGLGLGCNGMVDVLIQPLVLDAPPFAHARQLLLGNQPFAMATVVAGPAGLNGATLTLGPDGAVAGTTGDVVRDAAITARARAYLASTASTVYEDGPLTLFVEVLEPPPTLIVCGAGDDARPLAATAADAGFRVVVVDHRPAYLTPERFPPVVRLHETRPQSGLSALAPGADTYVVIVTHSLTHDRDWLRAALDTQVPYVGLLGPRERGERILDELAVADRLRVFSPVGLDLGADGPEQIAVAIVAELLAVRAARAPRHLRERESAIHAG